MLTDFKTESDIHANCIHIMWQWSSLRQECPGLKLVRCRRAYPIGHDDGFAVVDLSDVLLPSEPAYFRIERSVFLPYQSVPEDKNFKAIVTNLFDKKEKDVPPARIQVSLYDNFAEVDKKVCIENIIELKKSDSLIKPGISKRTVTIITTESAVTNQADRINVVTGDNDLDDPGYFEWRPAGGVPEKVEFFQEYLFETELYLNTNFNQDTGETKWEVSVYDAGLDDEETFYYTVFAPDSTAPDEFITEQAWRGCAVSTRKYNLGSKLYQLLPDFHKSQDEPVPEMRGKGELRNFLEIFGQASDQARSLAESLKHRHDLIRVNANHLPQLSRMIGWDLDQTLDEISQRKEIRSAPEVYKTIGTVPNISALVYRITGWDCIVNEFVHNVFRTNAPELIRLWEIWETSYDGAEWTKTEEPLFQTDGFDGRPAAVQDKNKKLWLFWHSDRNGRRDIMMHIQDGAGSEPKPAVRPNNNKSAAYTDEYPAVTKNNDNIWLFWSSNEKENYDIWCRKFDVDTMVGEDPVRLTEHSSKDGSPAAVCDDLGNIWLFWQSTRRGPTDIWSRMFNTASGEWEDLNRITTADIRHESPTAVVDAGGNIRLFFSSDLGSQRNIDMMTYDGSNWDGPEQVTHGDYRDESPCAVVYNHNIWLFWHSNRNGIWQIWCNQLEGGIWQGADPITSKPSSDKEPVAVIDADDKLKLIWRSQRRGEMYKSRTVDTDDEDMLRKIGTPQDYVHYTYDIGRGKNDWYSRDTIGIFLKPDTMEQHKIEEGIIRITNVLAAFMPVTCRAVFIPYTNKHTEYVYLYGSSTAGSNKAILEFFDDKLISETTVMVPEPVDVFVDRILND